jgi:proteasome lid subunit RPN8/RPN11
MMKIKGDVGTTLVVWDEQAGICRSEPNLTAHEITEWGYLIMDAMYHNDTDPDIEMCGILKRQYDGGVGIRFSVMEMDNVSAADGSTGEFMFSDDATMNIYGLMEVGACMGIWHTHPNGDPNPSATDWIGHPRGEVPMYIVALDHGSPKKAMVVRYTEADRP